MAEASYVVDVWIDIKSPHSYLIMRPALELMKDYHCVVRFRPYNLSYVEIGVSTVHDLTNPIRRPADAQAERKARMYYSTAKHYALAQGLKIRGPHSLMNATLANIGLLYAGREGRAAEYALAVYDAGWPSGWREFNMEDVEQLKQALHQARCSASHVAGFEAYIDLGRRELQAEMDAAEALGCVGVPHLGFTLKGGTRIGWFGREHLSFIRHQMHDLGLAKGPMVMPDTSHVWRPHARL